MRACLVCAIVALFVGTSHGDETKYYKVKTDGSYESGWVVQIPAGTSDYFNSRFDVDEACHGAVVCGISIASFDFGASVGFPRAGHFGANLALDPTGNTPDFGDALGVAFDIPCAPDGKTLCIETEPAHRVREGDIVHKVVCFPPGDPGLCAIGADTDTDPKGGANLDDCAFFTTDGYVTPAVGPFSFGDWGLGCNLNCCSLDRTVLSLFSVGPCDEVSGDYDCLTTAAGCPLGFAFWGHYWADVQQCDLWRLFVSVSGVPIQGVGRILPSLPIDKNNDGEPECCYFRAPFIWPCGFGGITFNFVAVSGCPGLVGSVNVSNEVTLKTLPDPGPTGYGCWDDCSYENGWVVQIPSGSTDYFSVAFGPPPAGTLICQLESAIMDFGTTFTAMRGGKSPPNLAVDPTGKTPDLLNPYVDVLCPFPPLTFVTTCGQLVVEQVTPFAPGTDVVGWKQFPLGDPALLALGADTNGAFLSGLSGWTLDGFSNPANCFTIGNWGIRCK